MVRIFFLFGFINDCFDNWDRIFYVIEENDCNMIFLLFLDLDFLEF